jgi:phytoene desaturase
LSTPNTQLLKAVIVGAGIGGIASAIRLANLGFKVSVYESNAFVGGKLSEFEQDGFRFDAGPSLFTMPFLVEELFWLSGKKPADYFKYIKLEETCRYFYDDGLELTGWCDQERFVREIVQKFGEDGKKVWRYLHQSAKKYEVTGGLFLDRSLHDWRTWVNASAFKAYLQIPRLGIFKTMHEENAQAFSDSRLIQLFDRFATYNGSSPYLTPGLLTMIPHLEHGIGAFFPLNGMYSITQSLVRLANDLGVEFICNTPVNHIVTSGNKVSGIKLLNDEIIHADVVISNADVTATYRKLLPGLKAPEKILSQPKSSSALIFYWGINRTFDQLGLHNIFFSKDYHKEFEHIFNYKTVSQDPTVYINITSKYKPDDAPTGCENWFTMINVPNNSGQNWQEIISQSRKNIINKLSKRLQVNIGEHIVCERILDPILIESRTSSSQGALYGNSSNNRYAAFFRHANFHSKIKGLYFCGGSVHPGGGIPLALKSANIVADYVRRDYKKHLIK